MHWNRLTVEALHTTNGRAATPGSVRRGTASWQRRWCWWGRRCWRPLNLAKEQPDRRGVVWGGDCSVGGWEVGDKEEHQIWRLRIKNIERTGCDRPKFRPVHRRLIVAFHLCTFSGLFPYSVFILFTLLSSLLLFSVLIFVFSNSWTSIWHFFYVLFPGLLVFMGFLFFCCLFFLEKRFNCAF